MNHRLIELHLRRGRLLERIANQRAALARNAQPVRVALHTTDRMLAYLRSGADYVKQHPGSAMLAVAALIIIKPGLVWRWSKRVFFAWQTWRTVREKLQALGS
ncbi:YqjK-like family protein [Propionivibrio sp.]|uniref:YqjK-like family protein n=1 Tax=Propionivibrio sp. TaxID=2212460 RepID=UPI003BF100C5